MIVYHGTGIRFSKIDLFQSKDKRDFGKGFYTTTILEQAENWARNQHIRYGTESKFVKEYEYVPDDTLKTRIFKEMDEEWLEIIKKCRTEGGTPHGYDIVQGPVANDNTMRAISLYISGIYTVGQAIEQLRFFKANDQVSFHTQRSLNCLHWIKDREV